MSRYNHWMISESLTCKITNLWVNFMEKYTNDNKSFNDTDNIITHSKYAPGQQSDGHNEWWMVRQL